VKVSLCLIALIVQISQDLFVSSPAISLDLKPLTRLGSPNSKSGLALRTVLSRYIWGRRAYSYQFRG
jgi:hypothetical protein